MRFRCLCCVLTDMHIFMHVVLFFAGSRKINLVLLPRKVDAATSDGNFESIASSRTMSDSGQSETPRASRRRGMTAAQSHCEGRRSQGVIGAPGFHLQDTHHVVCNRMCPVLEPPLCPCNPSRRSSTATVPLPTLKTFWCRH